MAGYSPRQSFNHKMKLIIVGANGFVATELIRQSLRLPAVDEVVAVSRSEVSPPRKLYPNSNLSKLQVVKVDDYDVYNEATTKAFVGADACIWTVAITPSKSKNYPFEEVKRVCHDSTIKGFAAMTESRSKDDSPFRFIYMSGMAAERDETKKPSWMPEYALMRGKTEKTLLELASQLSSKVEVCAAKPGLIVGPDDYLKPVLAVGLRLFMGVPSIKVDVIAAAMLHEATNGITKEPLFNNDLEVIGQRHLPLNWKCCGQT